LTLYERLSNELERAIKDGVLKAGERLPSIRQTCQARQLSVTTVSRAYLQLESRGLIESRPQSGYFVRALQAEQAEPAEQAWQPLALSRPSGASTDVDVSRLVLSTLKSIRTRGAVPLGSPYPDPALFQWRRVHQHMNAASRHSQDQGAMDDLPPGNPELIRQIARRHLESGLVIDPHEIIVTAGATEAINLCLQAVAKPGDTIAVESPTYYAMLHAIERMGMRAVEVPTHPDEGIDLDALARAIGQHRVAACMVMPNFQNPLGFMMRDEKKRALVALAERHALALIENGVYNELHYGDAPPTTLKSFDTQGLVMHCSSFSKSLTAGVRIGWALAGRWRDEVEKLKFLNTLATPLLPQLAVAEYLKNDGFDHHLRRVRQTLAQRADIMTSMVRRFFPADTRLSRPKGGYVLWIELSAGVDTMDLYREALERGTTIGPGRMFSTDDSYGHFMRLNYSYPWTSETEAAVIELGRMAATRSSRLIHSPSGEGQGGGAGPSMNGQPLRRP
jgi:DNA-binding transcriptional MocR family regulator